MGAGRVARRVSEALPRETWDTLESDESAVLVDVRSRAEWVLVGIPDLTPLGRSALFVEWAGFPDMSVNPRFAETVVNSLGPTIPDKLFFLCRSGARSLCAAEAVAGLLAHRGIVADCINVAGGFEGDLDADRRRGRINGWKARGMAWRQS